jgi:antitoxin (DNA-binding transcriptional repressor) of toxin-antitoxin stability system
MPTVTLQEAQARLPELLYQLQPGEQIIIADQGRPLAQVKKLEPMPLPARVGCYPKAEFWMAPDFDAPLPDFKEYME